MHLKPPTDIKVVKKEEKEAFLRAFIIADLENLTATKTHNNPTYSVIVRSTQSPVFKALSSLKTQIDQAGVTVKMIISTIDDSFQDHPPQEQTAGAEIDSPNTRLVSDHRLFDAHEQLVLSENRVWIGDIMRREPAKRDAYENYNENCETSTIWAKRAFDRLWEVSKPTPARHYSQAQQQVDESEIASFAATVENILDSGATIGTRH